MRNLEMSPDYLACPASLRDRLRSYRATELEKARDLVEAARKRDALAASRPEGCWCLGSPRESDLATKSCTCAEWAEALRQREERTAAREAALKAERALYRETQIRAAWDNSGVQARWRDCRFESDPNRAAHADIIARMTSASPDSSWFLWGAYGVGKTGLAVSYAWEWLQSQARRDCDRASVRFVTLPDLCSELRDSYERRESGSGPSRELEVIQRYAGAPLLVLDEMGREAVKNDRWLEDRMYQLIGRRHGALRPTVFTSNYTLAELEGKMGESVCWRIIEMCGRSNIIEVKGANLRQDPFVVAGGERAA